MIVRPPIVVASTCLFLIIFWIAERLTPAMLIAIFGVMYRTPSAAIPGASICLLAEPCDHRAQLAKLRLADKVPILKRGETGLK
jgi:hypothetical protein